MSTITMTEAQVGALHDIAVAFSGSELDVTPAAHLSLDVTVYTPGPDEEQLTSGAVSVSVAGTVRSRDAVAA